MYSSYTYGYMGFVPLVAKCWMCGGQIYPITERKGYWQFGNGAWAHGDCHDPIKAIGQITGVSLADIGKRR